MILPSQPLEYLKIAGLCYPSQNTFTRFSFFRFMFFETGFLCISPALGFQSRKANCQALEMKEGIKINQVDDFGLPGGHLTENKQHSLQALAETDRSA